MSDTRLKTAVLGLNDEGRLLSEAILQVDYFRIQAVADKDSQLAEPTIGQQMSREMQKSKCKMQN